eukprot:s636_g49.t1
MKRPAAAVPSPPSAEPPAPSNPLSAEESAPKTSENTEPAHRAKVPKRLRAYVAEKAVTPDEVDTQDREVADTLLDEQAADGKSAVESTQSSGSIGSVLRGQNLLRGASSVHVATSDDEDEDSFGIVIHVHAYMHYCTHASQEGDGTDWYPTQEDEEPTPSPSPPPDHDLAVPNPKAQVAVRPQPDEAMGPPAIPVKITSTTHRREFMALGRVANGPRATEFPEVARLFNGTKVEQRKVLAAYVQSGENLAEIEASFNYTRTHSEKYTAKRKLMTLKDMRDAGFSEYFVCILHAVNALMNFVFHF